MIEVKIFDLIRVLAITHRSLVTCLGKGWEDLRTGYHPAWVRPRSLVQYLVSSSSQKWMHGEGAGHSRRDRECSYLNMVWKKYKKTKKPARAGKLKLLLPSLR